MSASVTGLYAGLLAIVLFLLSQQVSRLRNKHKVSIGHGGVEALERAIRVQANFVEYVPTALLLLLLAELNHGKASMIHAYGAVLVFARVAHALGLSQTINERLGRMVGTILTMLILLGLATVNIRVFFTG